MSNINNRITGKLASITTYTPTGEITDIDVPGNISANTFQGSGELLDNITLANIAGIGNVAEMNFSGDPQDYLAGDGGWRTFTSASLRNITKISDYGYGAILIIADDRLYCIKDNSGGNYGYIAPLGPTTGQSNILSGIDNCFEITFPNETVGTLTDTGTYGYSAYALFSNGNLYTWGYNGFGQLGLGDTTNRNLPTLSASGVQEVYTHSSNAESEAAYCRLIIKKISNTYWGCGYNGQYQLGLGNTTNQLSWQQLTWILPSALSVWNIGSYCGAVIVQQASGSITVTGHNSTGQLGLGNTTTPTFPTNAPLWQDGDTTMRIISIQAGQRYVDSGASETYNINMFLDNGTTSRLAGAGSGQWGSFGNGFIIQQTNPVTPLTNTGLTGRVRKVLSTGSSPKTMYVLMENGDLFTYGFNSKGQVGNGSTSDSVPVPFKVMYNVEDIMGDVQGWTSYGYLSTAPLVKTAAGYWSWGYNAYGLTGNGTNTESTTSPTKLWIPKNTEFKMVGGLGGSSQGWSRLAVTVENTIIAFGYNSTWAIDPTGSEQFFVPIEYTPNALRR